MARHVVRHLVDDLDGSDISDGAGESLEFTIRGLIYTIDLSLANIERFDNALKPFTEAATSVRRGRAITMARGAASVPKDHYAAIRDWARRNGYQTGNRGRIRADILDAFTAAH